MTRMVEAELLKLRRNRAVWIGAALVVFALPLALLAMTFLVDRERLGGTDRTIVTMALLLGPGLIGAAMIGTTAGGADREAGVLRSLLGCPVCWSARRLRRTGPGRVYLCTGSGHLPTPPGPGPAGCFMIGGSFPVFHPHISTGIEPTISPRGVARAG